MHMVEVMPNYVISSTLTASLVLLEGGNTPNIGFVSCN